MCTFNILESLNTNRKNTFKSISNEKAARSKGEWEKKLATLVKLN